MILLLKNIIFTIVVPGMVAVYIPFILAGRRQTASDGAFVIGLILLVAGGAIYCWCVWDFAAFGRGTPAPIDEPKRLVVRGLYRYTRNPMYIGVLTVITGWAVLYWNAALLIYAFFVAACFHLFIVLYEERHLRRVFGLDYEDYCAHVGRWFPITRRN